MCRIYMNSNRVFVKLESVPDAVTDIERLLLREYGAVFIARGGAVPPPKIIFTDEADVAEFQGKLASNVALVGEYELELQAAAMDQLLLAVREASAAGTSITPRGLDSAKRDYSETVSLWASRVEPALDHWTANGRLKPNTATRIRALSPFEQVTEVLRLEAEGIWFAKDLSKSIIYSVAPPGTSQHLSMLAFDCAEFDDPLVRKILAKYFWYQTVVSDLPHFTFLGVPESDLTTLGLKRIENAGRTFWVPEI